MHRCCHLSHLPHSYKFSRGQIFAQFAWNCAKISTEFLHFCAQKKSEIDFRKTYRLFFVCIAIYHVFKISKSEGCAKINTRENFYFSRRVSARKFVRVKISTNKVACVLMRHSLKETYLPHYSVWMIMRKDGSMQLTFDWCEKKLGLPQKLR